MITLIRWSTLFILLIWLIVYWKGGSGLISGLSNSFRSRLFHYDAYLILGLILLSNILLWTGYLINTGRIQGLEQCLCL